MSMRQTMTRAADRAGFGRDARARYAAGVAAENAARTYHRPPVLTRVPLTANQHILHLLLTVFTAGLWAPVWLILAIRGSKRVRG